MPCFRQQFLGFVHIIFRDFVIRATGKADRNSSADQLTFVAQHEIEQSFTINGRGNCLAHFGRQRYFVRFGPRRKCNVDKVIRVNGIDLHVRIANGFGGFWVNLHCNIGRAIFKHLRLRHRILHLTDNDLRNLRSLAPILVIALQTQFGIGFVSAQNEWTTASRIGEKPCLGIILFGSVHTVDSLRLFGRYFTVDDTEIGRSNHVEEFRVRRLGFYNHSCFIRRFYRADCIRKKRRAALNILQTFPRPLDVLGFDFGTIREYGFRIDLEGKLSLVAICCIAFSENWDDLIVLVQRQKTFIDCRVINLARVAEGPVWIE